MGEGAADLAGTDQCDLGTCHTGEEPRIEGSGSAETGYGRFRPAIQVARQTAQTATGVKRNGITSPRALPSNPMQLHGHARAAKRDKSPSASLSAGRRCA